MGPLNDENKLKVDKKNNKNWKVFKKIWKQLSKTLRHLARLTTLIKLNQSSIRNWRELSALRNKFPTT